MNRELKRVSILVVLMFVALLTSTSIIQVVQVDALDNDPRNVRTLYESYSAQRGPILVDGQPIAESVPVDDEYKFLRTYPQGDLYSSVTGYLTLGGQPTGIEGALNEDLSGSAGSQFFDQINRVVTGQEPVGDTVELTIDPAVQQAAYDALGDQQGAVVALDPATGAILALVSKPGFDPNLLSVHDTGQAEATYQALLDDPAEPLQNRAIGGSLNPPGSVFKLVVTSAALESGRYTPDSEFPNPSTYQLPGSNSLVNNSEGGSCGGGSTATIATALRLSCNIPFAELGVELGEQAIGDMARAYGFGQELDVPMSVTPSSYPRGLDDAQTALSAFGQGDDRATPMQMAMVSAGIANGGVVMRPTLIEQILAPDLSVRQQLEPTEFSRAISDNTSATLTQMMVNGVENGAASNARIGGVSVAGKTGTAENGEDDPYTLWFTGFAPADNPRVAVAVVVENGGGLGQTGYGNLVAAPIAKAVMEAVLNK
ncbi:penicillin-binding protein 2 [Herbiconiux sp. L3-i23]|uniref:peptidoglycan D,D-transpeptidase FtsI family protein n=1 Tax=Herbiconiux sp. L3-i23 TaxID=2905871 RepID=UPI00206A187E|nr:penicillin-binding transpeptidase domain-containing protein [Herbiconiux sp. L3-i23]BDI21243.1 cell division protein FtsI [Herbiconiux sp. L3-i23]